VKPADNEVTILASAAIRGDSLHHHVVFDGERSLGVVATEGVVQLRFKIDNGGALYSFAIDSDRAATTRSQ
jgi:hypothetical protein